MLFHKTFINRKDSDWVVFVHGAGGSSSLWFKQIKPFSENYNVLLLDLRGHGKSQGDSLADYFKKPYTFESVSEDILEVLDHLKIDKAHFVGISLGTIIIRTIAEIAPERVKSIILGGAIARLNFRSKLLVKIGDAGKKLIPYMWLYRFVAWIIMPKKRNSFSRSLFIREAQKLCQKEFIRWYKLTADLNPLLKNFEQKDLSLPSLYIMGADDYMFLPQIREYIKTQTHAILHVINCGHVCNIESPDDFNRLSLQFLLEQKNNRL